MAKKPPPFKKASSFNYSQLGSLYAQVADHQRLRQRVCSQLPEQLAKQVLHCAITNKKLLVYTQSSAWASQLRFYQNTILANLAQGAANPAETLQVKIVAMQSGASLSRLHPASIPSAETIAVLQKQTDSLSDIPLRLSLSKLIATLKKISA